jgi:hypothetical protein
MTPAEFTARTAGIAYHHRGAFFSELYLFVSLCLDRGVTQVIESGVYHGVSSRVFRAIWPGRVVSIECRPESVPADLAGDVVIGDGVTMVPSFVKSCQAEVLGVFLDGPKGNAAIQLREWCLAQPQVQVVGQHDSPLDVGEFAHSYDRSFRKHTGDGLDLRIDPALRSQYINGCPGMGVWVRE